MVFAVSIYFEGPSSLGFMVSNVQSHKVYPRAAILITGSPAQLSQLVQRPQGHSFIKLQPQEPPAAP